MLLISCRQFDRALQVLSETTYHELTYYFMRLLKSNRPSSAPTAHNADNQQQQVDGEDGQLKAAVAEELRELTQRIERNYLQSL